jgi:hypothetical protein
MHCTEAAQMPDSNSENKKLALSYANENRKSEIALLWTRALYFWGFIATLFVLYAVVLNYGHRTVALFAACLGAICSCCWTLANRSSKYWQEVWEKKTESEAVKVGIPHIFPRDTNPKDIEERWFWGPKQYSPSKLAIAVSDLIFIAWVALGVAAVLPRVLQSDAALLQATVIAANVAIILFAMAYGFAVAFWCRSGTPLSWDQVWCGIKYRVSGRWRKRGRWF